MSRLRFSFTKTLLLLVALSSLTVAQQTSQPSSSPETPSSAEPTKQSPNQIPESGTQPDDSSPATKPSPQEAAAFAKLSVIDQAWEVLSSGLQEQGAQKRATAVRVLSLLVGEPKALTAVSNAMDDPKPEVRAAGAFALGELGGPIAIKKLHQALEDKEPSVAIAAANALLKLHDPAAYKIFYAVLTGNMKGGKGLIASQMAQLKDPKQMALLGFQEGIGYVPFAGMGYDAYRAIRKDDSSPVRAAAAKALTHDPDPQSQDALVQTAVTDRSELVRNAALDAISKRGDPSVMERLEPAMHDEKDSVKYSAAATILHLHDLALQQKKHGSAPKSHVK